MIGLRLLAPADIALRTCVEDCVLPHGGGPAGKEPIYIQKGTQIEMNFNVPQQDKDFWGPNAAAFDQGRWQTIRPRWECIPFFGGPRVCPAQQMVLTQIGYVLAKFLQKFQCIENKDPELDFIEQFRYAKCSKNGIKVAFSCE